jgi:hypothetical protein
MSTARNKAQRTEEQYSSPAYRYSICQLFFERAKRQSEVVLINKHITKKVKSFSYWLTKKKKAGRKRFYLFVYLILFYFSEQKEKNDAIIGIGIEIGIEIIER